MKKLPFISYLDFLMRYRFLLLGFITFIMVYLATFIKDDFVYNDQSLWLNGSKEYNKLISMKYPRLYVEKFIVDISSDNWNETSVAKLKELQKKLIAQPHVRGVNSLFEQKHIVENSENDEQKIFERVSLMDESDAFVVKTIDEEREKYQSFISENRVNFYILSTQPIELDNFKCKYPYELFLTDSANYDKDMALFMILLVILIASFTIAFKSIVPSLLGIVFIGSTTVATVALFQMISSVHVTHISIILLAVTVSVMDFIYIYYKWHVLQQKTHGKILLYRVLSKTVVPIFWTSLVSIVGIGSLIFVDSQMLYSIGLNVMLSSITGFILSFTMLPILLSYFKQKNPQIITKDSSHFFAEREAHYHKIWLNLFLILSGVLLIYNTYLYIYEPMSVEHNDYNNNQIHIALSDKGLNLENVLELQNIQNRIKERFPDTKGFESAYNEIRNLYTKEHPSEQFYLQDVNIDSYSSMFDLYGITKTVMTNNHLTLTFYLGKDTLRADVLKFIRGDNLLIQDTASLIELAKVDSIKILFNVVFYVLFLIMLLIFLMTRTIQFTIIALVVNVIPLVWFFTAVMTFNIPLSTEILVAMIVTVALSSDATMHFIFYYHNNRKKPRNETLALERSFMYIGTPLGMGNLILMLTFIMIIFIPDSTISNIGLYSALLVTLSLIIDLFVLPVLFLHHIRENDSIEGYYHGE